MRPNYSSELYGFRDFFILFTIESMANLDPRGMIGWNYIGNQIAYKMVFDKFFPHYKANDPWACGQFRPKGHGLQDFYRGPLNIAIY